MSLAKWLVNLMRYDIVLTMTLEKMMTMIGAFSLTLSLLAPR
jgi:hypothetical protein